jgi:predicted Zn-dependent protease
MRRRSLLLTVTFLAVLAGPACTTQQRIRTETALAQSLISDEQSNQIGEQVHRELEANGVRYLSNRAVTSYVESISAKLFDVARRDRPGVNYHVHVIDDAKTVNAFATPGGHLYVYSGLILATKNEAELAGVLSHEAGHVVGRHVERAMVNSMGFETLASMALGQNPSALKALAANVLGTGILRAHSRSEEIEADEYGAKTMAQLRYDPNAMVSFFGTLGKGETKGPAVLDWMRTHPVTQDRISNLQAFIQEQGLRGTVLGQERHATAQQQLGGARARR